MTGNENKKNELKKVISLFLMIIFAFAAMTGFFLILMRNWNKKRANEIYENMASSVNTVTVTDVSEEVPDMEESVSVNKTDNPVLIYYGAEIPEKTLDWDSLKAQNEDIYAWLCVPGTLVDYPVLQHPSDNTYYLMHNIDGSYGYPACLFTETYNSKDFTDYNTVIYGHNMQDGTMFASLHYFETIDLTDINNFFYIYTEDEIRVYLIVAAYQYTSEHLLLDYDMDNVYVYEQFLKDMFKLSNDKTGGVYNVRGETELNMSDRIVTLSTCVNNHNSAYRYLVVGQYLTSESYD